MTDAQFDELRSIQLAQLLMLESMQANLVLITQAALAQAGGVGRQPVNYHWGRAKAMVETARANLPTMP